MGQGQPVASVHIVALPPGPHTIAQGGTHEQRFQVNLRFNNVECVQSTSVQVLLEATSPGGLSVNITSLIEFPVPAGVYSSTLPTGAYNRTEDATLRVDVPEDAVPGLTTVNVRAFTEVGSQSPCPPDGIPAAAPDAKAHTVNVAGEPPVNDGNGNGNDTNGNGTAPPPPPRTPGFAPLAALGVLAAIALRRRR